MLSEQGHLVRGGQERNQEMSMSHAIAEAEVQILFITKAPTPSRAQAARIAIIT
jgi:hypothetical protein